MAISKLNLCRRCATSLQTLSNPPFLQLILSPHPPATRPFFSKRRASFKKPTLRITAPDPSSPPPSVKVPPPPHDEGLSLGEHGIPVPTTHKKKDFTDEKSWAETVLRTLSGGMKSDYIKCTPVLRSN
jgi:hypothetical protein